MVGAIAKKGKRLHVLFWYNDDHELMMIFLDKMFGKRLDFHGKNG